MLRVALLNGASEPLQRLLEDVLKDGGIRHEFVRSLAGAVDAAVVMVTWGEDIRVVSAARARAAGVPLLVILPFSDDQLAERVLGCGAQAWYALDTPLARLRALFVALAAYVAPVDVRTT
jgi:hypothetical protein